VPVGSLVCLTRVMIVVDPGSMVDPVRDRGCLMASRAVCAGSGRSGRAVRGYPAGSGKSRARDARLRRHESLKGYKACGSRAAGRGSNRFNGPTRRWEPAQRTIAPVGPAGRRAAGKASRASGVNRANPEAGEVTAQESLRQPR
jgi:hypothetical protein